MQENIRQVLVSLCRLYAILVMLGPIKLDLVLEVRLTAHYATLERIKQGRASPHLFSVHRVTLELTRPGLV